MTRASFLDLKKSWMFLAICLSKKLHPLKKKTPAGVPMLNKPYL